jgi:signal transduction histidine kinase
MAAVSRRRVADLPLFWKLLAPSVALTLVLGVAGTFSVVRYLSNEAQSNLDNDLSRAAVSAEVAIGDETDYLVETGRVNSHVDGVQDALARRRTDALAVFLGGAAAVRDRADVFAFTDARGNGLVELRRTTTGVQRGSGAVWSAAPSVTHVLRADVHDIGDEPAGLFDDHGTRLLIVTAPVIANGAPVGAAIVGTSLTHVVARLARQVGSGMAIYDGDGTLLRGSKAGFHERAPALHNRSVRTNERVGGKPVATTYAPVRLRGGDQLVVAVSLPRKTTVAGLAGIGARVAIVFLLAMIAVVLIGALIARSVLRRVRELLAAQRTLAAGDLAVRAPTAGRDEFGELAAGFNDMVEQLQASYAELERRVAERTAELQRLYDESVEAAEARSEFFAAISHELRTPLFVIAGHAELMAHPELQPQEQGWEAEFGQTIHQSALDLLSRVNDILDLAKLETKKVTLDIEDVSLAEVTRSLTAELAPLARQAGLRMSVDIPADLSPLRADPARFVDILRNLVANAIKYTPRGGHVTIAAHQKSKRLAEVSVSDTGIGIPDEAHDYLFEPFYQVPGIKAHNRQTSTGLGLALAHRLVLAHGGTMRLQSKVGEGSTFSFTIPTAAPVKRSPERSRENGTPPNGRAPSPRAAAARSGKRPAPSSTAYGNGTRAAARRAKAGRRSG